MVNSLFDTLAMAVRFALARTLPTRATIALVVVLELGMLAAIRDNLMLNIVQLATPGETLSRWQSGADGALLRRHRRLGVDEAARLPLPQRGVVAAVRQ